MTPSSNRLDSVLLLLTGLLILFVALLMVCAMWIPNDGQTFQVISGLTGTIGGALLMRVKHQSGDNTPDMPPGTGTLNGTPSPALTPPPNPLEVKRS